MDYRLRNVTPRTSRSSVGSLPLKGGGQEGVVAAAMPWEQDSTRRHKSRALSREIAGVEWNCLRVVAREARRCRTDPLLSSPFQGEGPDRKAFAHLPTALSTP